MTALDISIHVADTITRAANPEHEWDRRAIDWPLTPESVVVEVGGYKGRWALQIAERYQPRLYVFEPQPWAADVCREVLGDRAVVEAFGLGTTADVLPMGHWGTDGCTFVPFYTTHPHRTGKLCEIGDVFAFFDIDRVDLMLINIEGYEYILIPHMLDRGILPDRLMVQFHTFADPDGMRQAAICQRLAECGYRVAWTYGVVLIAWERAT